MIEKKVLRYELVRALTTPEPGNSITDRVNVLIAEGWQPYGSPFNERYFICQAVVLREE